MKYLVIFGLCLALLMGCSATPAIEQMPTPEAEDNQFGMEMDYKTVPTLSRLWNYADWVVVGYYENKAPTTGNIARDPSDLSKESSEHYFETLVYQFHIVEVLKGELDAETLPVGLFHGIKINDVIYPHETFQQPDLLSYKVMFLRYNEINEFYEPAVMDWWLSTEHTMRSLRSADWTTMTFEVEDTRGWKDSRALDMFADASVSPAEMTRETGSAANARTSCTGAELLALAE